MGQQNESQAGKLRAILASNIPAQASVVDQLGLDENWKHNLHAAERAKQGRFSGRLGSSVGWASGRAHWFKACLILNRGSFQTSVGYFLSP